MKELAPIPAPPWPAPAALPGGWDWRLTLPLAALALLLSAPLLAFPLLPQNDTAAYYAPMARELAAGRWAYGFCPTIPPLLPCLAGGLAALGVPPLPATGLVSLLFMVGCIFPAYRLLRCRWDARTALLAVALLLLWSRFWRYGLQGLRSTPAVFFLLALLGALWAYGATRRTRWALAAGAAAAGGILVRSEGVLLAGAAGLALLVLAWRGRRWRGLGQAAGAAALLAVLIAPWLAYVQRQTGWLASDPRQAQVLAAAWQHLAGPAPAAPALAAGAAEDGAAWPAGWPQAGPALRELVQGLNPLFLAFALPVLYRRWRRRRWSRLETVLLATMGAYLLFLVLARGEALDRRHVVTVAILQLGWTAEGLRLAYRWLGKRRRSWLWPRLAAGGLAVAALGYNWGQVLGAWGVERDRREYAGVLRACAEWLRAEEARSPSPGPPLAPLTGGRYCCGRLPIVAGVEPRLIWWAQAELAPLGDELAAADAAQVLAVLRAQRVRYLVWNDYLAAQVPALAVPPAAAFEPVFASEAGRRRAVIYRLRR